MLTIDRWKTKFGGRLNMLENPECVEPRLSEV
jgi:hypothetical protein